MDRNFIAAVSGGLLAFAAGMFAAHAAPVSAPAAASVDASLVQTVGYRHHHRWHRHRHHHHHHYRHSGFSHAHCGDWYRCHYYFYGYKQWRKWNPGYSRAYFYRRYHHY